MKAIILAAGEGTRLSPLTNTTPKPLLKICGKSIIEYTLESLHSYVDEFIIITKYKNELFPEKLWNNYKKSKITYIIQWADKWTGGALFWVKLQWDFLVINGDSIFDKKDLETLIKDKHYGALVQEVENPEIYWVFKQDSEGFAEEIIEKPETFVWNLANLWVYKFNEKLLKDIKKIPLSKRGEYEITDAINLFCRDEKFKLHAVKKYFVDIGYPWDILKANSFFLNQIKKSKLNGEVEKGVHIHGNVILEKWAIIKSGTYIEGNVYIESGAIIGPNAYIRGNTVIGKDSKVGFSVELKNSSIGEWSAIPHLSYIGDSVIGNHVNLWGGTKVANLRHDNKNIKVMVKDKLIDSGLRKLWAIIGDGVKTGINTMIYPGRIIETNGTTIPGEIIK